MDAKLIIVGGKANKSEIALRLPTIIGRSRDADLTMAHPMVSRQHCELYEVGGLLKIRDLGSLNGTFVADEQIREADLYPNSELTVGPLTFRVEYEYVGEIAAAPQADVVPEPTQPVPAEEVPGFAEVAPEPAQETPSPVEVESYEPQEPEPAVETQTPVEAEAADGTDVPAAIAPIEGELPDFDAWAAVDSVQAEEASAADESAAAEPEPLLAPPEEATVYEEQSTAQFDAVVPPPPEEGPVPVETHEPVEAQPEPEPPDSFGEAETERIEQAEEDSISDAPPPVPEEEEEAPLPTPTDNDLDDFLKGLE